MCFRVALSLFLTLCVAISSGRSEENGDSWRTAIPSYHDNLVVVGDVFPHVRRVFGSEWSRRLVMTLEGGRRGGSRTETEITEELTEGLASLDGYRDRFPLRVVVATSQSTLRTLGDGGQASLLGALAMATDDDTQASRFRRDAAELLSEFKSPRLAVWAEFPDETLPRQALGIARGAIGLQARQGLQVDQGETWVDIESTLGMLVPGAVIGGVLETFGVVESWDSRKATELAKHFAGLKVRARLERFGSAVLLRIGPKPPRSAEGRSLPLVESLWHPGPEQVLYGQWETTALVEALTEVEAIWDEWRDTAAGGVVAEWDDEDLLTAVKVMRANLQRAGTRGAGRLLFSDKIAGKIRSFGHEPTPTLKQSGILDILPRDSGLVLASSIDSLSDWLTGAITEFEDRVARQSLKAELRGDESYAQIESFTKAYYRDGRALRRLVFDQSPEAFRPPAAMVLRAGGQIESFRVSESRPGSRKTATLSGVPIPEIAFIGRVKDAKLAKGLFIEGWAEALRLMQIDPPRPSMAPYELGLGAPTAGFLLPQPMQFEEWTVSIELGGEPKVHVALRDDWLVFSTSQRLSKELFAALDGGDSERYDLPASISRGAIAYGSYPPDELKQLASEAVSMAERVVEVASPKSGEKNPERDPTLDKEMTRFFLDSIGSLARVEWVTRQAKGTRQTDLAIEAKELDER